MNNTPPWLCRRIGTCGTAVSRKPSRRDTFTQRSGRVIAPGRGAALGAVKDASRGTLMAHHSTFPASQNITARARCEESLRESPGAAEVRPGCWRRSVIGTSISPRTGRSARSATIKRSATGLTGMGIREFIKHVLPRRSREDRGAIPESIAEGGDWIIECRVIWPDGSLHWIAAHSQFIAPPKPATRMLGIVNGIPTRKTETALREADRRKDEFLRTPSTQMRNPLASVADAATLPRRRGRSGSRVGRGSHRWIKQSTRASTSMTCSATSRASRVARSNSARGRLDAASCLESACEAVAPGCAKSHASRGFPAREWVEADPTRLEQIVVNLLANAAKYGGIPRIHAPLCAAIGWRNHHSRQRQRHRHSARAHPEMFDYSRRANALRRVASGLGIGLTVARGL